MASNALSILSGIGAAAAGLAGDKVSKNGSIPGLDIASIIPALLGQSGGAAGGILGKVASVASVASKAGLLNNSKLGNIAELAGTLLSVGKADAKASKATDGIAGLAAAIMGGDGSGSAIASIASMALGLGKTAKDEKSLTGMASDLGKTLAGKFGVSLGSTATDVKALDNVMEPDTKTDLFKTILKGIVS